MTTRLTQELSTSTHTYPRLERVRVSQVKEAEWNPRKVTRKSLNLLEKSYEEFGNLQPIVINKRTNRLLAGHQRLKILRRKKVVETDAWVVDQSIESEKVIAIALNNHAADFDLKGLGSILADLQAMKDDLDHTLFTEEQIDRIVQQSLPQLVDIDLDNNNTNSTDIENSEPESKSTPDTNKDVSNVFKYDLYFENATDKLKFLAYIKKQERKRTDIKLNGENLLIAFKIP